MALTGKNRRVREIVKALRLLAPLVPYADAEAIREAAAAGHLRALPPSVAVWLSLVAHVRHAHTQYHALLEGGYDRDSARYFVVDEINDVLTRWRATRLLDPQADLDDDGL